MPLGEGYCVVLKHAWYPSEYLSPRLPRVLSIRLGVITAFPKPFRVQWNRNAAHQHSLPLLVDEAWGPHFGLHPGLPQSALHQGADCVVQSAHKLLAALSQASLLHVRGNLVDRGRLHLALRMLEKSIAITRNIITSIK